MNKQVPLQRKDSLSVNNNLNFVDKTTLQQYDEGSSPLTIKFDEVQIDDDIDQAEDTELLQFQKSRSTPKIAISTLCEYNGESLVLEIDDFSQLTSS